MSSTTPTTHPGAHRPADEPMSHRQIMEALSGLLIGMFVAILSSTVVSNALPTIVADLHGSESGYTWVVTATLLATTISTPIWGKLSDLFSKKLLIQLALGIFVVASAVAGLSQSMGMLIAMRAVQGLGAGGLTALAQVIMASMIAPRERGRYSGYLGAVFALGTVSGPLIGGALTEHLSWHWCFYVGVPFALLAIVVLQKTLHLTTVRKDHVRIDYLGATLLAAGVASLLVWVSLAGQQFDWGSWQTAAMVGGGIVLLALTVLVESRAAEPIIPLRFFRNPTVVLSAVASLFVGVAMFGGTVFLSQYFQLARGASPTASGLRTLPMILGLFVASTVAGQFITRTGRWKGWILTGGILLTAGLGLMGTVEWDTNYWVTAAWMALIGLGVGMMMQNLVLAVQNVVAPQDLGSASSFVAFARSLGGAIGVSALGAVLAHRVTDHLTDGLRSAGISAGSALGGSGVPNLKAIPEPVRGIVQAAYGSSVADVFLVAAPFALLALLVSFFFKEVALRGAGTAEAAQSPAEPVAVDDRVQTVVALGVTGTVRRHGGTGLADAVVTLTDAAGRQVSRTRTDATGRYTVAAPTGGTYLVIVAAPHTAPSATLVPVADRATVHDVVLAGRSAITGRVLAGEPAQTVTDALVTLTDVTGEVVGTAHSDTDGTYSFGDLMGGAYVLTAQLPGHRPQARALDVPDAGVLAVDLQVAGGGRLVGTVVAAADGRPVPEALVTVLDGTGQVVASTTTPADGRYRFDDLPGGDYTVTAAGYSPVARTAEVEDDVETRVDVALGAALPQGAVR
ncbi:MFS transporter [Kineococcus rhizosphaerae]|uniref:EmrB/QacA subfamily drug resistance transporter n=1 Tax=Kineococcus rhizosphaerae TaxID=559628 RepID=A0A2T0QYH7_9ACTN|nr:MFS transporter [Kineococcus rhizosphaerae]PRY11178.1 EmrB/QacA subfamily drug resistance transporter [Kineococcus rhizosphaerae]